ncbi:Aldo/keto reductase [Macleaya cordata]|uniref:Aldo/keto reductase n=1 Tax=Macleaya cordata TaxID=56857 RepID=A0A200QDT9_MACCD|nr:Aldo/keto reductase [Macleaya cordata]
MAMETIPKITLSSSGANSMPVIGFGTAAFPLADAETVKLAVLNGIEAGYRHFDTAAAYGSEKPLGEAIAEALRLGLIKSRDEVFITTKLWCSSCERSLVVPSLKNSLRNLQMEYVDLFLIHWPIRLSVDAQRPPIPREQILTFDTKSVWEGMEECHELGLAKNIGVSNFYPKKIDELLATAKIPPAINQVELNPTWKQKNLIEYCKAKGIHITAYSALGANSTNWGDNRVIESDVLGEIARAREKTTAQVALRWVYEQGVTMVVKSFNKERMKQNLQIFDFELTEEESNKITQLPQYKGVKLSPVFGDHDSVEMAMETVPKVTLSSGGNSMPIIGFGTAMFPTGNDEAIKSAVLSGIEAGYRHFDTAVSYRSEKGLGEGIAEALRLGLIKSRDEVFITTKLWCNSCERSLVVPSLKNSLRNLQMEYVDLFLIHWPIRLSMDAQQPPLGREQILHFDTKSVWEGMEECHELGLAKNIGVSNFYPKVLDELLATAKIPPTVNQVELNPTWNQKNLIKYCKEKGIHITAYSTLGAKGTHWGDNRVMDNDVLGEIAKARGKTTAQVALRWVYEQGVSMVVKSFNKERMEQNLQIFDFELTEEESNEISQLPQHKGVKLSPVYGDHDVLKEMEDQL